MNAVSINALAKAGMTLAGVLLVNADLSAAVALEAHRWEHRLLLVFSPRADDLRVQALGDQLEAHACKLTDRDLVVGRLPIFGDAILGEERLAPETAARIRNRFKVDFGDFAVVLVGKDGYEKLRSFEVPDMKAMFALIDGMPMRQSEMRTRDRACANW